jgi:Fe-S cluster biogenesis protein NfuA/nitrite reductase/ring-hydroxylating ferredoxin subunit
MPSAQPASSPPSDAGRQSASSPPSDAGWQSAGERIEKLLAASADTGTLDHEHAEELVRLVADLYGAGLARLLDLLHERGALTDEVATALARDDLVSSLLMVHGLHPYPVETRIEQALAEVRPYLGSHGGDVELLGVGADGVVRLRMLGSCDGCPSSLVTLKLAVEGAVEAAAPEITAIEVEEPRAGVVIPAEALFGRRDAYEAGSWQEVPELATLAPGAVSLVRPGIVACRIGPDLFAFEDGCPRCGQSLVGSALTRRLDGGPADAEMRCPACHAHYDIRRAGACLDDDTLHLVPLPLLSDGATASIAVPAAVAS